jgi:hypothetical protein
MRSNQEVKGDIDLIRTVLDVLDELGSEWPKTLKPALTRLEYDLIVARRPNITLEQYHYKVVE